MKDMHGTNATPLVINMYTFSKKLISTSRIEYVVGDIMRVTWGHCIVIYSILQSSISVVNTNTFIPTLRFMMHRTKLTSGNRKCIIASPLHTKNGRLIGAKVMSPNILHDNNLGDHFWELKTQLCFENIALDNPRLELSCVWHKILVGKGILPQHVCYLR